MHKILFALASVSLFVGCAHAPASTPAYFSDHVVSAPAKAAPIAKEDPLADDDAYAAMSDANAREVGDFVVYRFSGSFRKEPTTLSEKVVAKKGDAILVDVVATTGKDREEIFVKMSDAPEKRNEVLGVSKMENGKLVAIENGAYEALLARSTLAADRNDATLETEDVTVDVGSKKVAAKRTTFAVRVGKKSATMHTLEADGFAWGDLGGDIVGKNGKAIYKAEIVDAGRDVDVTSTFAGDLDEL